MPEIETDKLLLTYNDYYYFKDNFKKTNSEKDEPNPDDFVNNGKFDYWKRRALHTVLEELLKHLRNHGIFWNREDKACSYISYILSEEVKAKNYTYDQEIFETFKGFINKYNTRPNFKSPHCSTSLVHVDSKMYDKMGKLYEMYELFKKFKDDNKLWQAESCSPVEAFLNQFNDFIRNNQPTNNDFKHILDEFRKEIKKDNIEQLIHILKYIMHSLKGHMNSLNQFLKKLNHFKKEYHPMHNMPNDNKCKDLHRE
ncbi:hypothetical protein PVIIG_05797 [Plasmodium vivax India VII]|uniref:Uncharacterized protein n=1 Tax=Plasmodium vivax India VII TaxID=1077284 RepID=A0A0J9SIP7_PLAVI|nr:hypothetical protein PVIIG_05797 [Plasmodium vivax India VII]